MNGNKLGDKFSYAYSERIDKHNHHVIEGKTYQTVFSGNNQSEAENVRDRLNRDEVEVYPKPDGTYDVMEKENAKFGHTEYQPEMWTIKKDTVNALVSALASNYENTKELLAQHDAALGRTTRKNKEWAETLERDMYNAEKALGDLHNWITSTKSVDGR